jgi:hypothetical protein
MKLPNSRIDVKSVEKRIHFNLAIFYFNHFSKYEIDLLI